MPFDPGPSAKQVQRELKAYSTRYLKVEITDGSAP